MTSKPFIVIGVLAVRALPAVSCGSSQSVSPPDGHHVHHAGPPAIHYTSINGHCNFPIHRGHCLLQWCLLTIVAVAAPPGFWDRVLPRLIRTSGQYRLIRLAFPTRPFPTRLQLIKSRLFHTTQTIFVASLQVWFQGIQFQPLSGNRT